MPRGARYQPLRDIFDSSPIGPMSESRVGLESFVASSMSESGFVPDGTESGPLDVQQVEGLFEALYAELRARAQQVMRQAGPGHTLQATALVAEAYMRIRKSKQSEWSDRDHFLRSASRAMRHVLVDHFRAKQAGHRPAGRVEQELDLFAAPYEERGGDLEELNEALTRLESRDPRMAKAIELRFFGGLENEEIARLVGMKLRSFERRLKIAKAWLHSELS